MEEAIESKVETLQGNIPWCLRGTYRILAVGGMGEIERGRETLEGPLMGDFQLVLYVCQRAFLAFKALVEFTARALDLIAEAGVE